MVNCKLKKYSTVYYRREEGNLLHSTFAQCCVYYTVKLQVSTELCLKYCLFERVLIVLLFP